MLLQTVITSKHDKRELIDFFFCFYGYSAGFFASLRRRVSLVRAELCEIYTVAAQTLYSVHRVRVPLSITTKIKKNPSKNTVATRSGIKIRKKVMAAVALAADKLRQTSSKSRAPNTFRPDEF